MPVVAHLLLDRFDRATLVPKLRSAERIYSHDRRLDPVRHFLHVIEARDISPARHDQHSEEKEAKLAGTGHGGYFAVELWFANICCWLKNSHAPAAPSARTKM